MAELERPAPCHFADLVVHYGAVREPTSNFGARWWFRKRPVRGSVFQWREDRRIAAEALEKVGMAQFAQRQISQLSGGQQQRVFLARALAQDARIYMMDEPFAGVDAATERAIIDILIELRSQGKTILVCLLYTSPSPRDRTRSRMPSSA